MEVTRLPRPDGSWPSFLIPAFRVSWAPFPPPTIGRESRIPAGVGRGGLARLRGTEIGGAGRRGLVSPESEGCRSFA